MIDLQRRHFPCVFVWVWTGRNSLHLFLTASLTSKYGFNIKGRVSAHTSVSSHSAPPLDPDTVHASSCQFWDRRRVEYMQNDCIEGRECSTEGTWVVFYAPTSPLTRDCFWHRMCEAEVLWGREGDVILYRGDCESGPLWEQGGRRVNVTPGVTGVRGVKTVALTLWMNRWNIREEGSPKLELQLRTVRSLLKGGNCFFSP